MDRVFYGREKKRKPSHQIAENSIIHARGAKHRRTFREPETEEKAGIRRAKDAERKRRSYLLKKQKAARLRYHQQAQKDTLLVNTESNGDVFQDVDPAEIAEYNKLYPKVENISDRPVHCTSCDCHIGTAPINEAIIKLHPILRVIQCTKCYSFYTSGEFQPGEDGSEFYCRWCGQGGEVYCCTTCPKVYCRRCIEQNLSKDKMDEILDNENWICFACDPTCMTQLKADYWALIKFIEKQKKDITNKQLTEKELKEAMNKDGCRCCLNDKVSNSTESNLPETLDARHLLEEPAKHEETLILDEIKIEYSSDTDNMLTINDIDVPADNFTINTPAQQEIEHNRLLEVDIAPSAKTVVSHTLNGFSVDLNTVPEQEIYRIHDDKLIQVENEPEPLTNISKIPSLPIAAESSVELDRSDIVVPNQIESLEKEIHTTTVSRPKRKRKRPLKKVNQFKIFAKSPLQKAKEQFEIRVENCVGVCQHVVSKMKMLIGVTSFKKVKTLLDIKNLITHLTNLLTYAGSHFLTLQDKCRDDLKVIGFDPDYFNSDDDVEILEPKTALIELDSDADDVARETRKAVENLLCFEHVDSETNLQDTVENLAAEAETSLIQNDATINETGAINLFEISLDQANDIPKASITTKLITLDGDIIEKETYIKDGKTNMTIESSEQSTLITGTIEIDRGPKKMNENSNEININLIECIEVTEESCASSINTITEAIREESQIKNNYTGQMSPGEDSTIDGTKVFELSEHLFEEDDEIKKSIMEDLSGELKFHEKRDFILD